MIWENVRPNLSFIVEKKIGNLHNEWKFHYPLYQRIGKNMFSTRKNIILNPLGILLMLRNFWPQERPWIFMSTSWSLTQADHMRNESTSSASLCTLNTDFMMNRVNGITFLLRSEVTLGMHLSSGGWFCCKSKLMTWSCRNQFYFNEFLKLLKMVFVPSSWII